MNAWKQDSKRLPRLMVGLVLLAFGIYLTKLSGFGMAPWAVFHVGLAAMTGIPFGFTTQLVGLFVLVGSMVAFRTKIGLGTILNVAMVGPIIVVFESFYQAIPSNVLTQFLVFMLGFLIMTFGRSLYISGRLGQGPRDGLFVGLAKNTSIPVKYIKLIVELTVFTIGVVLLLFHRDILWVSVGLGTIIIVLFSGYLVQWYFQLLHYHPQDKTEYDVLRYFKQQHPS